MGKGSLTGTSVHLSVRWAWQTFYLVPRNISGNLSSGLYEIAWGFFKEGEGGNLSLHIGYFHVPDGFTLTLQRN